MKKLLSIAALTLLAAACAGQIEATNDIPSRVDAGVEPSPTRDAASGIDAAAQPDAGHVVLPGLDAGMDAQVAFDASQLFPELAVKIITGATTAERTMIADGVGLANLTMKTPCFKAAVLSARWTETNGLSQAQIYDKLCSGTVSVDADLYTGSWYQNNVSHTVGYENEPGTVHMNRYFVDTAYMVADNLIHEAEGHSQGFSHYAVKSTSVPYGLNAAFEACSPVPP